MTAYKPVTNEFRSDTFTTPTQSMYDSIFASSTGDSVYGEDDDTLALEKKVAQLCGKEAGLFCVSGTMSNQIGIKTHLSSPPHSLVCDYRSHVYQNEASGLAMFAGAMVYPATPANGKYLTLEDIQRVAVLDSGNVHFSPTRLVSLENTITGVIIPLKEIVRIKKWCQEHGTILHCDGARLWNASVESGVSMAEYGSLFDSISLCLSKSLGAPIGSVLVGTKAFIKKANHWKKQLGGGIRQSGMIARMGIIAIDENLPKLKLAHAKAHELATFLEEKDIPLQVPADTNFVVLDFNKAPCDIQTLLDCGKKHGVNLRGGRIAFHFQVTDEHLEACKRAIVEAYEISATLEKKTIGGTY